MILDANANSAVGLPSGRSVTLVVVSKALLSYIFAGSFRLKLANDSELRVCLRDVV